MRKFLYMFFVGLFFVQISFSCFTHAAIVSQDTVINVLPGIWWVDNDLIYEGTGSNGHDNFVIKGSGPASRIALKGSARIIIRNMGRWAIENVQIVKVLGSIPIDHMVVIENSSWGLFKNNFLDGFGLAAGIAVTGNSGGNWFDQNKILDVAGLSYATRGIGIKFDTVESLDNRVTNTIMHPFQQYALGDSMLAVIGQTAGYYIENLNSNPCRGCWTIDIEGVDNANGVHRESQIFNVGTAINSGDRGAIRIVKAENITVDGLMIEGMGTTIFDHLVHLDCYACTITHVKFNNIHTALGFDFFYPYKDRSVQFGFVTVTRSTTGREFIHGDGADEVAIRVFP